MPQITLRWGAEEQSFDGSRPIRVGRAPECDVVLTDDRISRDPHLVIRHEAGIWILQDESSSGTWSNGQRITGVSLPGTHVFNLGAPDGTELTVEAADEPAEDTPQPPVGGTPSAEATPSPDGPPTTAGPPVTAGPPAGAPPPQPSPTPGGPPAARVAAGAPFDPSRTVALDDRALRLSAADEQLLVPPGNVVVIGRDESCDLTLDSPIVSRQHARFGYDGQDWILEDLGSTRGTFVDGRRITRPYRAHGVFEVLLGDDDAGERVRVITAGEHLAPKSRSMLPLVLAAVAVVIALAVGAFALLRDDGDTAAPPSPPANGSAPNTTEQISTVKGSTVLILALDEAGELLWSGSGTVITPEGHILTNAHVADPDATSLDALESVLEGIGTGPEPTTLVVAVAPTEDAPVEPRYVAEWRASAASQDASIIQITEDYDTGEPVSSIDLQPIPIGSSSLPAGAAIHSLGYPDNANTASISVKDGVVISFIDPDEFEEIVGGDARKVMNTDAILGEGSSGGPIIRDGQIVGINFSRSFSELDRGWVVPVDEIRDLLAEVGL